MYIITCTSVESRAHRATEGGERACNFDSAYTDDIVLSVTKNSIRARKICSTRSNILRHVADMVEIW